MEPATRAFTAARRTGRRGDFSRLARGATEAVAGGRVESRSAVRARRSAGQAVGTRKARGAVDREALAEFPHVAADAGGGAAFRSRRKARSAR